MDTLILQFVLFLAKIFVSKDVDFEKLKIITQTKLILDRRRVRVTMKQKNDKEPKNQVLVTIIVYAFMGLIVGSFFFGFNNFIISSTIMHSYVLIMMCMALITDFSSVLLDTTDNQIILPRPVNSKTFFVARLVHILVYLLQYSVALAFFPLIFTFILYGFFVGIASIFTILLTVLFAVFVTYLLYGLVLKFSNEEKLKSIINGFQIVVTIIFVAGFQIVPRLVNFDKAFTATMPIHWYSYLLPPFWMAHALQIIYTGTFSLPNFAMLLLAIVVPLFTFYILIKFLAPSFANKIAAMGNAGGEAIVLQKISSQKNVPIYQKISTAICSNTTEQAGFNFTWILTGRDKMFKMQFYPSLAYLVVFAFIFVFKSGKDVAVIWNTLGSTNLFLWFIYLPIFTITTGIGLVAFNENFAASWIYLARPLAKPGSLISGSLKTLLVKFFAPIIIILFCFAIYVWGYKIIDDFALGVINNILIIGLMSHIGKSYLPFSMQLNVKQNMGKIVTMLLQLFIVGALVTAHYFALKIYWLVWVLIPIMAAGCYLVFKTIQNYSWQKISS